MQGLFAMRVWSKSGSFRSSFPAEISGLKITHPKFNSWLRLV